LTFDRRALSATRPDTPPIDSDRPLTRRDVLPISGLTQPGPLCQGDPSNKLRYSQNSRPFEAAFFLCMSAQWTERATDGWDRPI
jgi:hypothetical protein